MKPIRQSKIKIFIITLFVIFFSSCNKKVSNENIISEDNSTITTAIKKEDINFNPSFSNDISKDAVLSQIYEGLTEYSAHGKISLNQAEEITKSDDNTKWTIKLRKDLKWSNNSELSISDYYNSWLSILDSENSNPNYYKLFFIKNAKKYYNSEVKKDDLGIKLIDNYTIEILTEYPVENLDEILSNVFLFPSNENTNSKEIISNGAFKIKEITDDEIILEKNDNYWDSVNVRTKNIIFKKIDNDILAYQYFDLEEIDFFGLPFYEIPYERRTDSSKRPDVVYFDTNIFEFLDLNTENELLSQNSIRNILNRFIDSNFVANYVLYSNSKPFTIREKLTLKDTEELKNDFKNQLKKNNIKDEILKLNPNSTKLSERILASVSKEWIDKLAIKISIGENQNYDVKHSTFNMGTTNTSDIKYYINHHYQNDDFSKLYSKVEDIEKDNYILPLYSRTFSVLINKKIQGLFVSPNGLLLIKNLIKK